MTRSLVLAGAAIAIAVFSTPGHAGTPSRIVFSADRAPTVTGEIWRLDPNGHRVDLSKSPYQDLFPAVSWDGRHVAFVSERGGKTAVYEVGIDGRGLAPVGLSIASVYGAGCTPQLGWQPHGTTLAVMACKSLDGLVWLVRPHSKPLLLVRGKSGIQYGFSWSQQGLLAVPTPSGTAVYDANGNLRWRKGFAEDSPPHWSPDGSLLGFSAGNSTVVVDAYGRQVIRKTTGRGDLGWVDDRRLAVGGYFGKCGCETKILDVRTGAIRTTKSGNWFSARSEDGKLAIAISPRKNVVPFRLGVGPPSGGMTKTYARVPGCFGDGDWMAAVTTPQFAGRSIVYQSWGYCDAPFANLYSVGTGIHRLTNVLAQETQPVLSPDGTQIAYVWAYGNGMSCKGCSDGIRIASASGSPVRTLTNPQDCTFDDSPTWSPDGTTILYSETGCDSSGELFTIPAAGGTPHDLGIKGRDPAWGPSKIAFTASDVSSTCGGLCTMNPDGSDLQLVAKRGGLPAWSRDGRLAYLRGDLYHRSVVVGSAGPVKLPFGRVTALSWSPDGTHLLLVASKTRNGISDLWSVMPNGTHPVQLTKNFGVWSRYYFGSGG